MQEKSPGMSIAAGDVATPSPWYCLSQERWWRSCQPPPRRLCQDVTLKYICSHLRYSQKPPVEVTPVFKGVYAVKAIN
ncbi:hypothetical protein E2C01_088379 [Portunus trituberculatus]|uniref:Uncharacterized protein n=1 Tax=Portunus trituberculatus TaxID=210409 RepID=A0A5B7JF86_PORTR|nr:hypothetical protein [Portunus trituberculatus]